MSSQAVFLLDNTIQHYDWGSPTAIPDILGIRADGRPWAELWLGAHPGAPSLASGRDLDPTPLGDLIHQDPVGMLSARVADEFGPRLPYLMKILASQQALSIQVHPKAHLARAGFHRENRAGVPLDAPHRTYKDSWHKPEMVLALTDFEALAGFRTARGALSMLEGLSGGIVDCLRQRLQADHTAAGIRQAFTCLLAARDTSSTASSHSLEDSLASVAARLDLGSRHGPEDTAVLRLAEQFPGDAGALAPLLLGRVTLSPGQALYLDSSEVHAYLQGVGVEIMAASDNVIRAGLTAKHIDTDALVESTSFTPRPPVHPHSVPSGEVSQAVTFRPPTPEFGLTSYELVEGWPLNLPARGPRIVLCLQGDIELVTADGEHRRLRQGASVFIAHKAGEVTLTGQGQAVCAWVP